MQFKKITSKKIKALEEIATAVLEGRASLYTIPTPNQIAHEKKILAAERDLRETNLPSREIAKKHGLLLGTVKARSRKVFAETGKMRGVPRGRPPRRTGVFTEDEVKELFARHADLISNAANRILRRHGWIVEEGHYSYYQVRDAIEAALGRDLLAFPKNHEFARTKNPELIPKIMAFALREFVVPKFLFLTYRRFRKSRREIPESRLVRDETMPGFFEGITKETKSSLRGEDSSVSGVKERLTGFGFDNLQRAIFLGRFAGMNNTAMARELGVTRAAVSSRWQKIRQEIGIKKRQVIRRRYRPI